MVSKWCELDFETIHSMDLLMFAKLQSEDSNPPTALGALHPANASQKHPARRTRPGTVWELSWDMGEEGVGG